MLEKPGAQNIAVCEKQGKQRELSGHWKSIKMLFLKKNNRRWHKKEKRMTNTSFNKRLHIQQNQI